MKLSLTIQTSEVPVLVPIALLQGSLEEKLHKAGQLGVQGIELISTQPDSLDLPALRCLLEQNGLAVSAVASGGMAFAAKLTLLSTDPQAAALARTRLDQMIDLAAALDAGLVTIGSFRGRVTDGRNDLALKRLAEILRLAGERAARQGIRLALEPLNRYENELINTAAQGLAFLAQLDHPAVGLLLDTYHINIEESSWTEPFERVMTAGKLFHVHLGDNNRLAPGRGLIDFRAIVRTLHQIGYSGWLSAELLCQPDADSAAQQTVDTMSGLLKELL
jgi:5-keto-L-gluconate epimerase